MPIQPFSVDSVLGGLSPTQYQVVDGQYLGALGVDPDYPITSSDVRTSGSLVPTVYEKFSGSNITGFPKWISTNAKDTNVYVYASDGKFVSYNSSLASETLIGTPTSGAGNGMEYYNNYIYIATPTDISRYGPLDGSPSLTNNVWTGATLGSLTALTNTTYLSLQGTPIPNHAMHKHGNNFLYFCDFANGQGFISAIKTRKVTVEGDTNDGSDYNVLDLPFGFYPTDIESFGTDLIISAIQTTDTTINQGKAALFLWDTTNASFYKGPIFLPDPIVTALLNVNGVINIFSGNAQNGFRISEYSGGDSVRDIAYFEEGTPPLAGAVDAIGNRLLFGTYTSYPARSASVFSFGSKNAALPKALHNVIYTTSTGATPLASAVRYVQQASNIIPRAVVGWGDVTEYGIDKLSTTATYKSIWRSKVFTVGNPFIIKEIRIPLGKTIAANMSIIPKIYVDDGSTITTLESINSSNFPSSRKAVYKQPEITDSSGVNTAGTNNFFIELVWGGTVSLPVLLPIEIFVDVYADEQRTGR